MGSVTRYRFSALRSYGTLTLTLNGNAQLYQYLHSTSRMQESSDQLRATAQFQGNTNTPIVVSPTDANACDSLTTCFYHLLILNTGYSTYAFTGTIAASSGQRITVSAADMSTGAVAGDVSNVGSLTLPISELPGVRMIRYRLESIRAYGTLSVSVSPAPITLRMTNSASAALPLSAVEQGVMWYGSIDALLSVPPYDSRSCDSLTACHYHLLVFNSHYAHSMQSSLSPQTTMMLLGLPIQSTSSVTGFVTSRQRESSPIRVGTAQHALDGFQRRAALALHQFRFMKEVVVA